MRFSTRAIHTGLQAAEGARPVAEAIFQTSVFEWGAIDEPPEFQYTRYSNPNRASLEATIASLEGGAHCTCFASGMAAIAAACSILRPGDHLLVGSDVYGGTLLYAHTHLAALGIEVSEFDSRDPEAFANAARPNSRLAIFESPTNPVLRLADIASLAKEAKRLGIVSVADNTFATPFGQSPLALGADLVMHSTTKYLGGHSDVTGGALATNDPDLAAKMLAFAKAAGGIPGPFDCWLVQRGIKTLELRMKRHASNARVLAQTLSAHPKVRAVYYPGLPSHPQHEIAQRQMRCFGGMLAFDLDGTPDQAKRLFAGSPLFRVGASLGGVETLVSYPPAMSHAALTEDERLAKGITPTLLRVSVGLEDPDDLIEETLAALARLG